MHYIQYSTHNIIITKNTYIICGFISSKKLTYLMDKYPIKKIIGIPKIHILTGAEIKFESEINLDDVLIYKYSEGF